MRVLVKNELGREMEMPEEDFQRLLKNGLKFKLVKQKEEEIPYKRIGIYLQRFKSKETYCASDRIRGEWIIKNSDQFEIYREGIKYDAVIFHKPVPKIAEFEGIKILDLCDSVWKQIPNFKELIIPVDAIIVSTEGLKEDLGKITDKPIHVVGDGHDLEYYSTKTDNKHINKAKEVVWFGYAQNAHCLEPLVKTIKNKGLKLKVLAQCPLPPLDKADEFIKWDVDTCIEEISKSDFAVLPFNGKLKSNNKDVTAYLSGIPVAKTEKDIIRLISPEERRKDMEKVSELAERYDAKNKAKKYLNIIDKLKNDIEIYTAICGNYEKERNDITVLTSDKFVDSVMNAKISKILPHKYFNNRYTVWIDGNISLKVNPEKLIELLGDADMALFEHPYRECIYDEHKHAKDRLPENRKQLIDEQVKDYQREGMPRDFGLYECGMIIRRNNKVVEEFNNRWWAEITRYSSRDQMSFPYVLWKMGDRIKVKTIEGNVRNHKWFNYEQHANN